MPRSLPVDDPVLGPLTDDRLTRDYRVFQRAKGHRFSSDDMVTAYVAALAAPEARRIVDLGCGLGSVLLHLAWTLQNATLVGVEAQEASYALVCRNIARNDLGARVTAILGDLREPAIIGQLGADVDLVTGTPPYFPPQAALDANDGQRAQARIEYRGGVEAYLATGARILAPHGSLVLCGDARVEERVSRGARAAGLSITARCEVLPQAGRPALFSVWTLGWQAADLCASRLTLRDEAGQRTADAERLRRFSGFAP